MIKRVYTADFINSVINHPSVREGVEIKEIADLSGIAANINNFILVNDFGGFVVIQKGLGLYECHTQFLPEGRGQLAVDAVHEAMRFMFLEADCTRIVTKVNISNKPARMFAGQFFRKRGGCGNYYYYSLDIEDWVERDDLCNEAGEKFHSSIRESVDHDDDSAHDSMVGAALLMAQHNNLLKGQLLYNRWALMSGYEPLFVLSEHPVIVQCGDMKLAIQNNEVMICR